jgi:hypothetical protein
VDLSPSDFRERSRLWVLLDHFSMIEDEREPHRVAYPLAEILLLAVCVAGWDTSYLAAVLKANIC